MKNQEELHYKSREAKGKRRACFVGLRNEDGTYNIGMAICSEQDKFSASRGHHIAKLRLTGKVTRPILTNVDLKDKSGKSSPQTLFNRTAKSLMENDAIKTLMTPNLPESKRKSWGDVSFRIKHKVEETVEA